MASGVAFEILQDLQRPTEEKALHAYQCLAPSETSEPKCKMTQKLIKKDSIWKPLLRRFRKSIREIINKNIECISIESETIRKRGKIYS